MSHFLGSFTYLSPATNCPLCFHINFHLSFSYWHASFLQRLLTKDFAFLSLSACICFCTLMFISGAVSGNKDEEKFSAASWRLYVALMLMRRCLNAICPLGSLGATEVDTVDCSTAAPLLQSFFVCMSVYDSMPLCPIIATSSSFRASVRPSFVTEDFNGYLYRHLQELYWR